MTVKRIAKVASIAALYVALTVCFAPISFGPIQIRIAEIFILLCFFKRDYCISMIVGCAIANLFSPELGYIDLIFGTLHTAISSLLVSFSKHMFVASIWSTVFMPIIAFEMWYFLGYNFPTTLLTLAACEFLTVSVLGYILFRIIKRNEVLVKLITE